MARIRWRWRGSEGDERARARRPAAASGSPREVKTRRKKMKTAAKKAKETRSSSVHGRAEPPPLRRDGGKLTSPIPRPERIMGRGEEKRGALKLKSYSHSEIESAFSPLRERR